jgi:hypothetical protein
MAHNTTRRGRTFRFRGHALRVWQPRIRTRLCAERSPGGGWVLSLRWLMIRWMP